MYRYVIFLFIIIFLNFQHLFSSQDIYFKINKSFDIYGAVFNQLLNGYVIELDPELLTVAAIEGMISSLDPYNEYFTREQMQDVDFLSSGTYPGLGITVGVVDSMLIVMDVRSGYPAQKGGLRIGDFIYMADSVIVLNKSSEELREYTKGEPGKKLNLSVIRRSFVKADTVSLDLVIENIRLPNVPYYGLINDSTGVIILERFTNNATKDFLNAFQSLKSSNNIKNLIIDLRGNPGGLLEEAVGISGLFLPQNSLIVTTKTRDDVVIYEYLSRIPPIDTTVNIAILINNSSASASEVIAGAIQDHDRGIIIGQRSFGKGLVQSVVNVPYGGNLKITTAKYFTPSGRCIQRIGYAEQYSGNNIRSIVDSSDFKTRNGRTVFESTGIEPDSTINSREIFDLIIDLNRKQMFFNFANRYYANNFDNEYIFDSEAIFNDFITFLKREQYDYVFPQEQHLDSLISELKNLELATSNSINKIQSLKTELESLDVKLFQKHKQQITEILEYELNRRFMNEKHFYSYVLSNDRYVKTALELLSNATYNEILRNGAN